MVCNGHLEKEVNGDDEIRCQHETFRAQVIFLEFTFARPLIVASLEVARNPLYSKEADSVSPGPRIHTFHLTKNTVNRQRPSNKHDLDRRASSDVTRRCNVVGAYTAKYSA